MVKRRFRPLSLSSRTNAMTPVLVIRTPKPGISVSHVIRFPPLGGARFWMVRCTNADLHDASVSSPCHQNMRIGRRLVPPIVSGTSLYVFDRNDGHLAVALFPCHHRMTHG